MRLSLAMRLQVQRFRRRTRRLLLYQLYRKSPDDLRAIRKEFAGLMGELDANELAHFHRSTGVALSGWAIMEERLVMVASVLLIAPPQKVGLIFYSIINFQVWITIITELFRLDTDFAQFRHRWNKIYERLRAEKDNRDRLAHHAVWAPEVSDNPLGVTINKIPRLDMRAKSQSFVPMTIDQVKGFIDRTGAIADDIGMLVDDMREHLKRLSLSRSPSQDKSSEPPLDQDR